MRIDIVDLSNEENSDLYSPTDVIENRVNERCEEFEKMGYQIVNINVHPEREMAIISIRSIS